MILVRWKVERQKNRKADGEQTTLKDMIGRKKMTILEIGYVADTRYEDKYKASGSATRITMSDP